MAKQAIDLGFYISFSGIITFKNAETLRETVKKIPIENILIETDSPYLAPVPNRGKLNDFDDVICPGVGTSTSGTMATMEQGRLWRPGR
jgi:TatD DNase family protein